MNIQIPKVSIIVPVHNAGERFIRCLDTLIGQTLREIEIILVLDCPTDGSDKIAKVFAAKDDRIIVLENETNLHIGNSRNRGLEIARGEYIGFSDHDDYRELTMYEELYGQAIKSNLELVLGNLIEVGGNFQENFYPIASKERLKELALSDLLMGGDDRIFSPYAGYVLPNLYKASFLKANNITFVDSKLSTPEDWIFQMQCLFFSNEFLLSRNVYYYHTIHDHNTSSSKRDKHYQVVVSGKNYMYNFLNQNNCYEQYKFYFFIGVKKLLTDNLLSELLLTGSITRFISAIRYSKSLPFVKEAFRKSHYSLVRYRFFGKVNRRILFLVMKI